jgi:hypothetical protein
MNNDEEEIIDYKSYELGELQEIIGVMEDELPKDKRSKLYKAAVRELNILMDIFNEKSKFKIYNKIKI